MADKSQTHTTSDDSAPVDALAQMQAAGLGNMMGMGTAWMEAMGDMGAEVFSFISDRIKEDVKTQHEIMHCKNMNELQDIQARFIQKAIDQYQDETGKLVKMSNEALAKAVDENKG